MLFWLRPPLEGRHGDERISQDCEEPQEFQSSDWRISVQVLLEMLLLRILRDYNDVLQAQKHARRAHIGSKAQHEVTWAIAKALR